MTNETPNGKSIKFKKKVKEGIPKDWLGEIRITSRIIMETLKGIYRTGWINIAIITTMAAILTIFGALFRTTISLTEFVKQFGNMLEISVYLKPDATPEHISSRIKELDHVIKVTIITKEEAWSKMKNDYDVAEITNPLPDTLHVRIDTPENINAVYEQIKPMPEVEDLSYASDLVKKMEVFNKVVHTMTLVVVIFVAILTIAIINNTIHLVIQNQKEEIEIMRLMGVSNWYIKIPLILQGAIYGFISALLALIPMSAVQQWLLKVHEYFMVPSPMLAENLVTLTLFIIAIGFGAGGSMLSIKKHLKV
ncbi:MAG: ABC transporter permease [Candidatus Gastranaerophilales bacterium]|nr:ABC transporter permease [Candidatus Gastranaerophilales bacterium]